MEHLFVNTFPLSVTSHIAGYIGWSLNKFFVYLIKSGRGIVSPFVKHQEIEIKNEIHNTGVVAIVQTIYSRSWSDSKGSTSILL